MADRGTQPRVGDMPLVDKSDVQAGGGGLLGGNDGDGIQARDNAVNDNDRKLDPEKAAEINESLANANVVSDLLAKDRSFLGYGLDDFIRPVLAIFGLVLLPIWLLVFSWNDWGQALSRRRFQLANEIPLELQDSEKRRKEIVFFFIRLGASFCQHYSDPHQFRRNLAYLMASLYAAVQAVVIFAAMATLLAGRFALGGIPLDLLAGSFAVATGLVNLNLATSFMVSLFTSSGEDWKLRWEKLLSWKGKARNTWRESIGYYVSLGFVAVMLSAAAAGIMGALTADVLKTLVSSGGLLAGFGPVAAAIPVVGGIVTVLSYLVMFFCDVRGLIHNHWKGDQTILERFLAAKTWAYENKGEFALSVLIALVVLTGLALTIVVGRADMVKDFGVNETISWVMAAVNFAGAGVFFTTGAVAMAGYICRLGRSFWTADINGNWGLSRWASEFGAKYQHGYALYKGATGFYRRHVFVNEDGESKAVFIKQFVPNAGKFGADEKGMVVASEGLITWGLRVLMLLSPLVSVTLTIAALAGVSLGGPGVMLGVAALFAGVTIARHINNRIKTHDKHRQKQAIKAKDDAGNPIALSDRAQARLQAILEREYLEALVVKGAFKDEGFASDNEDDDEVLDAALVKSKKPEHETRLEALTESRVDVRNANDYESKQIDLILRIIGSGYQEDCKEALFDENDAGNCEGTDAVVELTSDRSRTDPFSLGENSGGNGALPACNIGGPIGIVTGATSAVGSAAASGKPNYFGQLGLFVKQVDLDALYALRDEVTVSV